MKKLIHSLIAIKFILFSSTGYAQNSNKFDVIKSFYKNVYDTNIPLEKVAENYLIYSDSNNYEIAKETINYLRYPSEEHFQLLKTDIINQDTTLFEYKMFDENDKIKFRRLPEHQRKNLYKIVPKNTHHNYLLFENNKIISFFGFQKNGSDDYYFIMISQ